MLGISAATLVLGALFVWGWRRGWAEWALWTVGVLAALTLVSPQLGSDLGVLGAKLSRGAAAGAHSIVSEVAR